MAAVAAAESGTTIPLARQGCVTGVVIVIIMVLVTASAYVAEAVPGHVVAVASVVTGAAPPIANIAANAANATLYNILICPMKGSRGRRVVVCLLLVGWQG